MIKIKHTELFEKEDGSEVTVAKGKFLLIDKTLVVHRDTSIKVGDLCKHINDGYCTIEDEDHAEFAKHHGYKVVLPIVVSKIEDSNVTDVVMHSYTKEVGHARRTALSPDKLMVDYSQTKSYPSPKRNLWKVLVTPDQFDDDYLECITKDKLCNDSNVYITLTDKGDNNWQVDNKEWELFVLTENK